MYTDRLGKVRVAIYFDENDWKVIEARAKKVKLNVTKYIRKIALNGSINIYNFKDAHSIIYEINKIGVNVNQIAKKVNETDNIYKVDVETLKIGYDELCLMLSQYLIKLQSSRE